MSTNRSKSVLAVGVLLLLLGGSLAGQDIEEMNLFAPAELSRYGSGPQPKQGYFFTFDGLFWSISRPNTTPIGLPGGMRRVVHHPGARLILPIPGLPSIIVQEIPPLEETQTNSHDTGPLNSAFTEGSRIEFGRVNGRHGWLFSTYRLNDQVQRFTDEDVDVVFADVPFIDSQGAEQWHLKGRSAIFMGYDGDSPVYLTFDPTLPPPQPDFVVHLPVTFDELEVENRVDTWGAELMYLRRAGQMHRGGFLEFFLGMRYLEFNDTFQVSLRGRERFNQDDPPASLNAIANERYVYDLGPDGDPTATNWSPIGPGVVLADSNWVSEADNHIIGPQIGGRWFRRSGRWRLSAEGRFFAGLNLQKIRNRGVLGSELGAPPHFRSDFDPTDPTDFRFPFDMYLPLLRTPYNFDNTAFIRQWSPGGELRLDAMLQLTRAISLEVGWTGLWLGGIARASAMPDYTISENGVMRVDRTRNDRDVFINGLNVGLKINR